MCSLLSRGWDIPQRILWLIGSIHSIPPLMKGSKTACGVASSSKADLMGLKDYPVSHDSDWFRNGHVTKEIFLEASQGMFSHSEESNRKADIPPLITTGSRPVAPRGTALGLNWHCRQQCGRWKDAKSLMTSLNFWICWSWSLPLLLIFLTDLSWRITLLYNLVQVGFPIAYSWKHSNVKGLRKKTCPPTEGPYFPVLEPPFQFHSIHHL